MIGNSYCLALYDVRGKQNYIFRNNHLKEIIGASAIIRDVFSEYLNEAAVEYAKKLLLADASDPITNLGGSQAREFDRNKFIEDVAEKRHLGEMIYDGGGNFFVLYRDETTAVEINKLFTRKVLEKTDTLKVLSTFISGVDFDDYQGDQRRLYRKHEIISAKSTFEVPSVLLPIVQVDPQTSLPLAKRADNYTNAGKKDNKVSYESYAKYKKYASLDEDNPELVEGENILDKLVEDPGNESLLAIVYIDGNNMGAAVENLFNKNKDEKYRSYEDCIRELRRFSKEIQAHFVEGGIAAINAGLNRKYGADAANKERRIIVFAGDEINFVVNARDAYDAVLAYFDYLKNQDKNYSACAGISIFHSHAPYADAYRIAEECCESGKARMKEKGITRAFYVDYEYNQGAIGLDLEAIRRKNNEYRIIDGKEVPAISKPWLYEGDYQEAFTTDTVSQMAAELNKIARTNVKTLVGAAKESLNEFKSEVQRIMAHNSVKPDFSLGNKLDAEQQRKLIYDIGIVYDIWFRKGNK